MARVMSLDGLAGRIAPFAGIAFVAYALSFALGTAPRIVPLTLSAGLTVAALGMPLCLPRDRVPRVLGVVLPLACFPAIALLRMSAGGRVAGCGPVFGPP